MPAKDQVKALSGSIEDSLHIGDNGKEYIKVLGSPITFPNGMTAPNRFLKSAMTERLCTYSNENLDERGKPTPEYIELYRVWGEGQIGTIVLGNVPVDRTGLEGKGNLILDKTSKWDVDPVDALKKVIGACKAHGSLVIAQLTHGGRQTPSDISPSPVSSSDVQLEGTLMGQTFGKPRPLTEDEIEDLVERFAWGAEVLQKAGCDGVQLHGAHGYLLSQFLSSRVNTRKDKFGGDLEGKSRIIFEIIDRIKSKVDTSKFILSIKLNSADFSEGGFTEGESQKLCLELEKAGVDLIELSGGTYESLADGGFSHKKESTVKRESFFIEFADQIRPTLKKTVLAVTGGFRSAKGMAEAITGESCQIVGLARPLTAEPYFCADILSGKITKAKENHAPGAVQTGTSIAQIKALSEKKPIPDLSDEKVAKGLVDAMMGKKPEEEQSGEEKKQAKDANEGDYHKDGERA